VLSPVRIPRVSNRPVLGAIFDSPSNDFHSVCSSLSTSYVHIDTIFVGAKVFIDDKYCLYWSFSHNLTLYESFILWKHIHTLRKDLVAVIAFPITILTVFLAHGRLKCTVVWTVTIGFLSFIESTWIENVRFAVTLCFIPSSTAHTTISSISPCFNAVASFAPKSTRHSTA
ncbi:unnamed protein product, partial [Haemonchus placei]|uniref:G_PROTEIN_RECEP_F1_2 domain-containing protein n=1 Tax=Haemonchus placei TaxID=6290 RepID=A0A0N4WMQ3_HAEPC